MTKRLVLARHARVDPQYVGRFLGSTDVPLSELGRCQARSLARSLPVDQGTPLTASPLVVSPLCRAVQTAEPLQRGWQIDTDLREIDFGDWEGRSFDEIAASDQNEHNRDGHNQEGPIDRWSRFEPEFSFPGGESLGAFVARVGRVADRLAANASDTVVAITHGGVIRMMICHLLGLDPRNYLLFDVKPASITTIDLFDRRGVLTGLSDMCHLKDLD